MPKLRLYKKDSDSEAILVKDLQVKMESRELGGANQNAVKGNYVVEKQTTPSVFIKAEDKKPKEFSELLAGAVIGRIIEQPGFGYSNNFAVAHPGVLSFPEDTSSESGGAPRAPQNVIVQNLVPKEKLLEKRRPGEELIPEISTLRTGTEKTRDLAKQFHPQQFAATIVMSILVGDYSVHSDNFIKNTNTNGLVRIDFGSSFRNFLRSENNKDLFKDPPDTKFYKQYIEIWSGDPRLKAAITEFMLDNQQFFKPEKMGEIMQEACGEVLDAAYPNQDTPLEDFLEIYEHLHGKPYAGLNEYQEIDYKEIMALNETKNALLKEQGQINKIENKGKKENKKLIELGQKIISLNEKIAEKSDQFNKSSPVDIEIHKTAIKNEIKVNMKQGMVKRAEVLIRESIQLGQKEIKNELKDEKSRLKELNGQGEMTHLQIMHDLRELEKNTKKSRDSYITSEKPDGGQYHVIMQKSPDPKSEELVEHYLPASSFTGPDAGRYQGKLAHKIADNIELYNKIEKAYKTSENRVQHLENTLNPNRSSSSAIPQAPVKNVHDPNSSPQVTTSPSQTALMKNLAVKHDDTSTRNIM